MIAAGCRHKRCRGDRCRVPQAWTRRTARKAAGRMMRWGMREPAEGRTMELAVIALAGLAVATAPLWVR